MAIEGESHECIVCHMLIPARAEVCPYCRYNQGYAKFWKGEGVVKALLIGNKLLGLLEIELSVDCTDN